MNVNISLPKGTRDFYGSTLKKRQYIISIIKHFFELYGFEALETPSIENTATLMGKYGNEGEKLIFKILNNGDILKTIAEHNNIQTLIQQISDRALRYDLTIPFARFVALNHNVLAMPFKRYQIQPVWRGDRPQRGRYREFVQCDADVVGSNSLLSDIEFIHIYQNVFEALKINGVCIKINSRKILSALIEKMNAQNEANAIFIEIDKIDKVGEVAVFQELQKFCSEDAMGVIKTFFDINKKSSSQKMLDIEELFADSEIGKKGLNEVQFIMQRAIKNSSSKVEIDLSLARGLNYYTGLIVEAKTSAVKMGSIGGGGRYDDLTASMGVPNIAGVGISFGIDRIYDVMEELNIFPEEIETKNKFLFFNMGDAEIDECLRLSLLLKKQHVCCEIYHQKDKLEKQFKYAEKKKIAYVIIIGGQELLDKQAKIKHIHSGKETLVPLSMFEKWDKINLLDIL